jgi:hypothetical protein
MAPQAADHLAVSNLENLRRWIAVSIVVRDLRGS